MRKLLVALFFVIFSVPVLAQPVATQWEWPVRDYSTDLWSEYYEEQYFLKLNTDYNKYHLGSDLNRLDGADCGKPVYSVADGKVVLADDVSDWGISGWGNVVVIKHNLGNGQYVSSLYGHLKEIASGIIEGTAVYWNTQVGSIGTADRTDGQ